MADDFNIDDLDVYSLEDYVISTPVGKNIILNGQVYPGIGTGPNLNDPGGRLYLEDEIIYSPFDVNINTPISKRVIINGVTVNGSGVASQSARTKLIPEGRQIYCKGNLNIKTAGGKKILINGQNALSLTSNYLTPIVGTVSIPDPVTLPNDFIFVFKIRGATTAGSLASQWGGAGSLAFDLTRLAAGDNRLGLSISTDGTNNLFRAIGGPAVTQQDEYIAMAITQTNGSNFVQQTWTSEDGIAWYPIVTVPTAIAAIFNSTAAVQIGNRQGVSLWSGRIYWIECRSGLDPTGGSILWKFDASEYPGGGVTSYVDPRGKTWTLTNTGCITNPSKTPYFNLLGGSITSPDGPDLTPTGNWRITAKVLLPDNMPSYQAIFAHGSAAGTRSWNVHFSGNTWIIISGDGVADKTGNMLSVQELAPCLGKEVILRCDFTAGTPYQLQGSYSLNNGMTWVYGNQRPFTGINSFIDASVSVGSGGFTGRLYYYHVESLDASMNPTGTKWKFDASEYPGTGTSYTDPRGRVWTVPAGTVVLP